jgi:hypothetical protein
MSKSPNNPVFILDQLRQKMSPSYNALIRAEMTSKELTWVGNTIPGLLLDSSVVGQRLATQHMLTLNYRKDLFNTFLLRQEVARLRLKNGEVKLTALIATAALESCDNTQIDLLKNAAGTEYNTWDLLIVPTVKLREEFTVMNNGSQELNCFTLCKGLNTASMTGVYAEYLFINPQDNHEAWLSDPESYNRCLKVTQRLSSLAISNF